jgi:hypothetical protein
LVVASNLILGSFRGDREYASVEKTVVCRQAFSVPN